MSNQPSLEQFRGFVADMKTFMSAVEGDEQSRHAMGQIPDERFYMLVSGLVGVFQGLARRNFWFRRYVKEWRKMYTLNDETKLHEAYAEFIAVGSSP